MTVATSPEHDFWAVGRKPVQELLLATPEQVDLVYVQADVRSHALARIVDVCKSRKVRYRLVAAQDMARLCSGNHQGVLARVFQPGFSDLAAILNLGRSSPLPMLLALDQIQDPGNVGVLARTFLALGGGGLILPKNRSAALGAVAAKTSAGALRKLPVTHVVNLARALEQCACAGYAVYGATVAMHGENIFSFAPRFPAVLVLGNEDKGVRPGVLKRCDREIFIPMPGAMQSLNVAQAGALCLGLFARAATGLIPDATRNQSAGQ